jgi:hypothetical protein
MSLGASLVIFAIGAILKWGITAQANGIDLDAVGVILMVVGVIGALVSMVFLYSWSPMLYRRRTVVSDLSPDHVHEADVVERDVVRERRVR